MDDLNASAVTTLQTHDAASPDNHEFCVIFKKEALAKLKELASFLDIPEEKLGDVLIKGLHVVDMAKEGKIIIETKGERLEIDIKKL